MILIYSSGGYSREFVRLIKAKNPNEDIQFVDDNPTGDAIKYHTALAQYNSKEARFVVGFADPRLRHQKTDQILADGFDLCSVQADSCIVGENVEIADGYILSDYSILTADSCIGHSFQCNIYSYIAHDCVVGDYVTLAPRVSVNGRVNIADHVYIGTGATILPGTISKPVCIGEGAIIGAHALVTKSVPAGVTVIGSPAKPIGT